MKAQYHMFMFALIPTHFAFAESYYLGANGSTGYTSIESLNSIDFEPGDSILFEAGKTFEGKLILEAHDRGTPDQPVVISTYGDTRATLKSIGEGSISVADAGGIETTNLNFEGAHGDSGNGITFSTPALRWGSSTYTSLESWRSASGEEMYNGNPSGYYGDPQINRLSNPPALSDPTALRYMDAFMLLPGSPLIDAGLPVNTIFGQSPGETDFFQNPLYYGGTYDIGAHEQQPPTRLMSPISSNFSRSGNVNGGSSLRATILGRVVGTRGESLAAGMHIVGSGVNAKRVLHHEGSPQVFRK